MFENMSYEYFLEKMLSKIPNNMDKREGSVIFDAIAPAAIELADAYISMDMIIEEVFAVTSSHVYLAARAFEKGITPHKASKAIRRGDFQPKTCEIPIGTRFCMEELRYTVLEKIENGAYCLECETEGVVGNQKFGNLIPVGYIDNLKSGEITEVLVPGEEEEETEQFRERYFQTVQKPSTSGNKYDYTNWALECSGVGAVQVFPLANGPGTVKLVLANSEKKGASQELLDKVSEYIEERRPVGATVSVVSSKEREINLTADIMIQNGVNLGVIQTEFKKNLESYLQNIAFKVTDISIAKIGSLLLDTIGVADFFHLKINNAQQNISLTNEEIPVVGSVTLGVV